MRRAVLRPVLPLRQMTEKTRGAVSHSNEPHAQEPLVPAQSSVREHPIAREQVPMREEPPAEQPLAREQSSARERKLAHAQPPVYERPLMPEQPSAHEQPFAPERPLVHIIRLHVKRDRIVAQVRVDPARVFSTVDMAHRLIERFPDLPRHACVNPQGNLFGDVIAHTALPHVLEHLVIELQVRAHAQTEPSRVFTGISRWTDGAQGLAQISVSYRDDLIALRAFRDAASVLNAMR